MDNSLSVPTNPKSLTPTEGYIYIYVYKMPVLYKPVLQLESDIAEWSQGVSTPPSLIGVHVHCYAN